MTAEFFHRCDALLKRLKTIRVLFNAPLPQGVYASALRELADELYDLANDMEAHPTRAKKGAQSPA